MDTRPNFDKTAIHSVELNLLDGQVDLLLRALELYGYNLEYMLNINDLTNDTTKQEKMALLKYTYEQILASQAEQVDSKSNNIDNISEIVKFLTNDNLFNKENEENFKII